MQVRVFELLFVMIHDHSALPDMSRSLNQMHRNVVLLTVEHETTVLDLSSVILGNISIPAMLMGLVSQVVPVHPNVIFMSDGLGIKYT